ncbi:MAG: hypothetical protein JWP97_568, partial [Labilithrix sp.]|nr:hypothetical protein [Labilithrix sp.]
MRRSSHGPAGRGARFVMRAVV